MSLNFRRPFQLMRGFPLRYGLSLALSEMARRFMNPHAHFSYSQTGEDQMIPTYFDLSKPGYYVDVGCHHPFKGSNTLYLYTRGWRGLAIDGNEDLVRCYQRARPRDTCVCAVVSNEEKPVTLAIARAPEFSTVSAEFEQRWIRSDDVVRRVETVAVRLQTLLERYHVPRSFELLTIDVEGHDYEVLTSFDIEIYRPRLVVVEMHDFDVDRKQDNPVYYYLVRRGYRLQSYAIMNGLFRDTRA